MIKLTRWCFLLSSSVCAYVWSVCIQALSWMQSKGNLLRKIKQKIELKLEGIEAENVCARVFNINLIFRLKRRRRVPFSCWSDDVQEQETLPQYINTYTATGNSVSAFEKVVALLLSAQTHKLHTYRRKETHWLCTIQNSFSKIVGKPKLICT